MSFKVPSFMSDHFNSLQPVEKKEAVGRYKSWYNHEFTQMLLDYLDETHDKLVKEDEEKSDFISKFQFSYISIRNKAQRKLLKELLKKIEWEV